MFPGLPPGISVQPLEIPAALDGSPAAEAFTAFTALRNAIFAEINGHDDESVTPEQLLPLYQPGPDELRFVWLIHDGNALIGRIGVNVPVQESTTKAEWVVELLRSHQGRGIGSAVYPQVESTARKYDRVILQSVATHTGASDERLAPPTGFGSVPRDNIARFYLRHGYTLEQIERQSVLELAEAAQRLPALLAEAERAAVGYRVVQWRLPTPAEYVEDYAHLRQRMSTDAPAASLEYEEEEWDADRVARRDAMFVNGSRTMLVTAAQEIATGRLVAFTELVIGPDRSQATSQYDTLVLANHRGHRLGLLVKCAGLRTWHEEIAPESPRVLTYNAEENRPMLGVNDAIGFLPAAYNGAWKKTLS